MGAGTECKQNDWQIRISLSYPIHNSAPKRWGNKFSGSLVLNSFEIQIWIWNKYRWNQPTIKIDVLAK
jgi:hypothetical protein